MKYLISILFLLLFSISSWSQINQISVGLGRADQWYQPIYTYLGDTAIGYESQQSMDSRMMYVVTLDHSYKKLNIYHTLAYSVMFTEVNIIIPSRIIGLYLTDKAVSKVPTFDYSFNLSLLRPTNRLSLYGGVNLRLQFPLKPNISPYLSQWKANFVESTYNSLTPVTLGVNLNLRYQTRWLRIEFGYIGDVTSSSRDFIHNGQIVNMAPLKMQKIYLVLSGPVFRREKPPKKLKKKYFIKN